MITLARIIRYGFQDFYRNIWLSVSTIGILVMMLFVLMSAFMAKSLSADIITAVQSKIDIAVYFKKDAQEDLIRKAQQEIGGMDIVSNVEYIPADQTLQNFKEHNKNNAAIIQAVEEIGSNPFQGSLAIKAKTPDQYTQIASYIENSFFKDAIDRLTFNENKTVIDKLRSITKTIDMGSFVIVGLLGLMAILVIFNTIRLSIYSQREEISIMKLVGASNFFVRAPFLVTGSLYGLLAAIIAMFVFWPLTSTTSPYIASFVPELNIAGIFANNFSKILLLDLGGGILLGVISSFIAVRRYLRV